MLNALIIDDEPGNIRLLSNLVASYCPNVIVKGSAENVNRAFALIQKEKPDFIFLDIEMPGGNAFALLDKFKPVNFEIIFVSAYDNYTMQAIKYSAMDYILKPVNIEELIKAVNKVAEKIHSRQLVQHIEALYNNLNAAKKNYMSLAIPASFGYEFIVVNNIIRCEASGKYTYFYMDNDRKIISVKNLKEYEDLLTSEIFFRIHHSHIINVNFIKRYHKIKGIIEMSDGMKIPLAARRKKEFLSLFSAEEE